MTTSNNKAVVIRCNKEFLKQGNIGPLKEIAAEDFINQTAAGSDPNKIEGVIQLVSMLQTDV